MPVLPTLESELSLMQGGIDVNASPNAFGAQIGVAVQNAGQELSQLARQLQQDKKIQDAETRESENAVRISNGSIELTKIATDRRTNAPADGSGVFQSTLDDQRKFIADEAAKITDPIARKKYEADMLKRVVPYAQDNIKFEAEQKQLFVGQQIDASLTTLENTIRSNPEAHKNVWIEGNALIEGNKDLPAFARKTAKTEWKRRSAFAHFNGMLERAASPEEFDAIQAELNKPVWKERLTPEGFNAVQSATMKEIAAQKVKDKADAKDYRGGEVGVKLATLENSVRSNAGAYGDALKQGVALIDGREDLTALEKQTQKRELETNLTDARFSQLLDAAQTPEELEAIKQELAKPEWQQKLSPDFHDKLTTEQNTAYGQLQREIKAARKTYMTEASTAARAAIESAEKVLADGKTILSPDELLELDEMARKSENPTLMRQAAELQRRNYNIQTYRNQPATVLDNMATTIEQNGYGLPDRVNTSIQRATTMFPGVSASFLGGTAILEYGVNLRGRTKIADRRFAPQVAGRHIDVSGLQPGTANAVTLAGSILGKPLLLTSAYRSQGKQDALRFAKGKNPYRKTIAKESQHTHGTAVDISTTGMSAQEKAQVFDALVQSGFTAFGDYGEYIHADMREKTPNSFNPATGHLGWTNTSPEVIAALTSRGYAAGIPGSTLKRGGASIDDAEIDYGKGTGNGATSATGLFQHTDKTWLGIAKTPGMAQRIGLPENLTDAQLLELRKDPEWSTMFAAAYAEQNQKVLSGVLGRPANDAELYMAHFLGAGGASTLLSAYQNNPDAIAAQMMPEAAANNPPRFTKDGRQLTVKEVYDNMVVQFARAPDQVQRADVDTFRTMAKGKRTREKNETMNVYSETVLQGPPNNLTAPGGFAKRGSYVAAAADLYNLPIEDVQPFMTDEADTYKKVFAEGSTSDKLALMANIVEMDNAVPGAAQAAFNQLGIKDSVPAYAADFMLSRNDRSTAESIMRGQDALKGDDGKNNTNFATSRFTVAGGPDTTKNIFDEEAGDIFKSIPDGWNPAYLSARALYVDRFGAGPFNEENFRTAVKIVTGTTERADINGNPTPVPPGVDPQAFSRVFNNLTDADLKAFSASGDLPIDIEGNPISADEVIGFGVLEYVGGHAYVVRMEQDDTYLVTGNVTPSGRMIRYKIIADPEKINAKANAPVAGPEYLPDAMPEVGAPVTDEQRQKLFGPGTD